MPTSLPLGRPARVGIVGLGRIYDLTIRGHRDNPDTEIVALCDRTDERLTQRGAEWPDAHRLTDYTAFLRTDPDVVEVLVPTPAHCEFVTQALEAGCHVNV
jgi:predicted dehydrogenase